MSEQIKSAVKAMTTMMTLGMTLGMASPVMLQSRRWGEPKSEAERRATHKAKYGTEKLPPRGTGLRTQTEYFWVICDYERKDFWGMLVPQPSVEEAVQAAKNYIAEKGSSIFPIGSVRGIEVYTKLPKWFGGGDPIRRDFIEVGM